MKKILSIAIVIILIVSGLVFLTGCGNNNKKDLSAFAGTYKGLYTKFVGDPETAKVENEEFSLELKADGTGTHKRNDSEFKLTWDLDGDKFTMQETFLKLSIDYNGTLVDGKLDIFNGDKTDDLTCEYVYQKQ